MNDPLQDLLAPTGPAASPALREAIWGRMLDALRRRRPPYGAVGVLLAGMAAGLLLLLPVPSAELPPPPAPEPAQRVSAPARRVPPSATDIEWRALEEDPSLYRQAADRYLEEGAPAEAARCYGHALDQARAEELELKQGDSSLLMAIKLARKEEMQACGR